VATGPLVRVISGLTGVHDLDDPALARLTREARNEALIGLAAANLRTGRPVVPAAPFSTERADPSAPATTTRLPRPIPPTPLRSFPAPAVTAPVIADRWPHPYAIITRQCIKCLGVK